ncbi:MAG: hypothetical protein ACU843_06580 [Gammaproteobacteria bacterium]
MEGRLESERDVFSTAAEIGYLSEITESNALPFRAEKTERQRAIRPNFLSVEGVRRGFSENVFDSSDDIHCNRFVASMVGRNQQCGATHLDPISQWHAGGEVSTGYLCAAVRQKWVPEIQMGAGPGQSTNAAQDLLNLFMAKTAKDLNLDMRIAGEKR